MEDVDQPTIGDDDVLVRVVAASVHAGKAMRMQGIPYVRRLGFGPSRPRNPVPGFDLAETSKRSGPGSQPSP
jgi:NADPH:quinone reductase-like Zn-dependent oxidoreductase